ncbi:pepsin-like aspartyl protease, partial [Acinetobacter baumannii]
MKLVFTLFLALFLARTSSIREVHQEVDKSENSENSPLHLPLYHVQSLPHSVQNSDSPLPFSQTLDLDEARVKFLSSRLTNKNSTKSGRLVDGKSVSVPLNPGEPLGIANYYTKIGIGTPTTNHLVVMDTGSSFSWIQCEPCAVYCHTQVGPRFNPSASVTYQKLPCDASQCSSLKKATLNSPMCSSSNVCLY